jgi:hypothetical protein
MPLPVFVSEALHHEAIDWATRVSSNGGTISTTVLRAVSDFCAAADRGAFRASIYRLNPFAGGNLSGALVPLYRGPTFGGTAFGNATDTNVNFVSADYSETDATAGLKGNGTNKYLNTGYPANTLAASSTHMGLGIVTANTLTGSRTGIGAYNGGALSLSIEMRRSGANENACVWTRFSTASDTFGQNVGTSGSALAVGNIVASWPTMYRNGTASGTTATTSQNYSAAHPLFVFAISSSGVTPLNYTDARFSWYSIGATMTATQVAAFSAAVAAFNTALGR